MDISEFYETFFEEAEELLADMEEHLLSLDVDNPDDEQLNAIFRVAHSIKGGAGTFGFEALQHTTHVLETLLDYARRGEMVLRQDIIDTFLEAKDMLHDQLDSYRQGEEPDPEAMQRICDTLQTLAREEVENAKQDGDAVALPADASELAESQQPESAPAAEASQQPKPSDSDGQQHYQVTFLKVAADDRELLIEELGNLGDVGEQSGDDNSYKVNVTADASIDDIEAVMCFVVDAEQLTITPLEAADPSSQQADLAAAELTSPVADVGQKTSTAKTPAEADKTTSKKPKRTLNKSSESSSIRVPVDKIDKIINLVGELVITQSMLNQVATDEQDMDSSLVAGLNLLQRNARDLQDAVMSVRMVPMDFVFSRFPRQVHDLAKKCGKSVELVTEGHATELDKSLTERIIDPLTHLVRNSLDHGIASPEERAAVGKPETGTLVMAASHQGGNILIEVKDDGRGLDRNKLLNKARERGLDVSDSMSDDEVWQLIMAPGFSTAAQVSDVSGRGVGMDVVQRNIQSMGGHVEIRSQTGVGTTIRIVLPLTLAIMDGMTVKVGSEIFILPITAVYESLQPKKDDVYSMANNDLLLKVRDDYLPMVSLRDVMQVEGGEEEFTEAIAVIVQGQGKRYALLVDDLLGQQQVVVKNLETNYRKVPGVSAATILGNGSVALILDVAGLYRLKQPAKSFHKETETV